VWRDLSGLGNHATLISQPIYSANHGGILIFNSNSTTQWAEVANNASINNLSGDFAYEIWVYPKNGGFTYGKIFGKGKYSAGAGFNGVLNNINSNTTEWQYQDAGGNPISLLTDNTNFNTWVHLVYTRNKGVFRLYKNSVKMFTDNSPLINNYDFSSNYPLRIAANSQPVPDWSQQRVGVFKQYNRGLSAVEVLQNFEMLRGRYDIPFPTPTPTKTLTPTPTITLTATPTYTPNVIFTDPINLRSRYGAPSTLAWDQRNLDYIASIESPRNYRILSISQKAPGSGNKSNYTSCGDNNHCYWNGSGWTLVGACSSNWIGSMTLTKICC
jgi:hypothetical protein